MTEKAISVYDEEMRIRLVFEGLNIRSCQEVHQGYLYTISDSVKFAPLITKYEGESAGETEKQENFKFESSGLYVYDLAALCKGMIKSYRLAPSTAGQSSLVSKSKFGNRLCFLQSYNNIMVIPFPHVNLIELIGMGQKNEYMIWREKDGFFTALDKRSHLLTWSLITGKMLYEEK